MTKKKRKKLFYKLTPICTIALALLISAAAFWEWRKAPETNAQGLAALQEKNYARAIHKFSQSQQYCETDISARYYLGEAYQGYGWDDEALAQYDVTWNLTREYGTRAMHKAGNLWFKKENYAKAIQCYDRALKLNSASPEVWYDLGQVHLKMQNFQSAEYCISEAVKYAPQNKEYKELLLKLALKRLTPEK